MKHSFALALVAILLLAGCAKNKAVTDEAVVEPTPVVSDRMEPVVPKATPEPEPEPVEVAEAEVREKVEPAGDKIFFEFDSSEITPASREILVGNSLWLQAEPKIRIRIEGHTDERGSSTYNLALGEKRAQAARDYLQDLGVAPERISIISYGEEKAVQQAKNAESWAEDRRADFVTAN